MLKCKAYVEISPVHVQFLPHPGDVRVVDI